MSAYTKEPTPFARKKGVRDTFDFFEGRRVHLVRGGSKPDGMDPGIIRIKMDGGPLDALCELHARGLLEGEALLEGDKICKIS